MAARVPRVLTKLRRIALQLPEAHEVEAWGTPTFRVKNKLIAMYASKETHVGKDGRDGVWVKATAMNQQFMLKHAPKRFFFPAYVGKSGWIGVYLDPKTDWSELADLLEDAYRMTAPKGLIKLLPERKESR
jgi:hypothetical protein